MRYLQSCVLLSLLVCSGCALVTGERDFLGIPASHGAAPIAGQAYPITRAAGTKAAWPNLGDVPARPPAPMTAAEIAQQQQALEAVRGAIVPADKISTLKQGSDIKIPATAPATPPELTP